MIDRESLITYEDKLSEIYSVLDFVFQKHQGQIIHIKIGGDTRPVKLLRNGYESIIVDDNGAEKELNYDQMAIYPFFRYIINSEENPELGVLMAEE